jgi:hypothetical protein
MPLVKAYLTRKDKPGQIVPFLFNPSEFSVEKTNQFTEVNIPGLPSSICKRGCQNRIHGPNFRYL